MEAVKEEWQEEKWLQWHPAFYAGIQIELKEEAEDLIFENEHQLGTKPMEVDVLVIKKQAEKPIKKNIGRIFRKYNIIEYKGPGDYLSIDDFYKVYGYVCFYKSDVEKVNSIRIDELTISLVSESYPRKMIRHLREERGFKVMQRECGIYEVIGDKIPIQIIVTSRLSRQINLWLNSLTKRLPGVEAARELLDKSADYKDSNLYNSVMDIIIKANQEKFKEARAMSGALLELFKEELEEQKILAEKTGRESGEKIGKEIGKEIGESRVNELNRRLAAQGRTEDIIKAASDMEYQKLLFREFNL